ncbi:WSC domain-containing [Hyphodiscus hymeniophilus]|uniref:WSC domain-containing n=1 Tax=Hyphodiscus hymeniophilus TaxID=353542 RepID=A0A9P7B0H8_9HELO|nr:WSC domain-containing [Hyphodiscus hymeniophilus]
MLNLKSFFAASAALTLVSGISVDVVRRNEEPAQPSCTDFTPFVYAGCFTDPSSPERALLYDSGLDTQNMTVEKCVAFCKGNDYKYAGLEYYGECFCGATVNGPQIDNSQCTFPCTGDKNEVCGGNDIISVYQDTTFPTVDKTAISDYQPMGCYSEGSPGRSLAWRQDQIAETSMTVESCLSACKDGGFSFAGIEYGQECYCGVVLGNGTVPLPAISCSFPCTGNSAETCGGSSALNLYVAKDLESTEPCDAPQQSSSSSSSSSSSVPTSTPTSSPTTFTSSSTSASSSSSSSVPMSTPNSSLTSSQSSSCSTTTSSSSSSSVPTSTPTLSLTSSQSSSSSTTTSSSSLTPSSTSCTTTLKPVTTTPTTSTTKTTASLCTSTVTVSPSATCEYKCGKWCSSPLPNFSDSDSCGKAVAACSVQLASCFLQAGFPESLNCFEFSAWCSKVSTYCGNSCPGKSCSNSECKSKYPPSGPASPSPTLSTSVYTCPPASATPSKTSSSSTIVSTTSCVPVPTNSNICSQPNNPSNGYTSSSPVGGIALPCLTCNNLKSEFNSGNCFKLYTSPDSSRCPSYSRSGSHGPGQGCKDACDSQFTSCMDTYAQGCKNNKRGDNYSSASQKCKNQWNDCYSANSRVSVSSSRCGGFNSGWW